VHVLAIAAHPDDIERGCRGALVAHRERGDRLHLLVMTAGGSHGSADIPARMRAQEESAALLGADLLWGGFPDGAVPDGQPTIEVIQAAVILCRAGLVFTHAPRDSDPDHRATAAATLSACRLVCRVRLYETSTSLGFQHRLCRQASLRPAERRLSGR